MIQDVTVDNFFQQFGTDRLEIYRSVVGGSMGSPALKMGITRETFQISGTLAVMSDRLKSLQRIGQIEVAVFFSIRLVIPSTPAAELLASFLHERKNIRARSGKTGKSGTQIVLRDGSIVGVSIAGVSRRQHCRRQRG